HVAVESAGRKQDQFIGWDRVQRVEGEHAAEADGLAELADRTWRARSRIERGDFASAEPLFEQLFASMTGHDGPTAAIASEGLLRCRLARGAQAGAVWPWLEWLSVIERSGGLSAPASAGAPAPTAQ